MDQDGGPAAPPRPPKPAAVHRAGVSLLRPRPEAERERNAYVEAPRRTRPPPAPHKPVTTQPTLACDKRPIADRWRLPDSIVCETCGKCRCEQCARPRPLPSKWLCDWCLCSAETTVDYVSCMCCVKAVIYHCGGEDVEAASEPCSCGGPRAAVKWGCMGALSLVLPCLWLYWPLRACAACCARIYSRATRSGCRCASSII